MKMYQGSCHCGNVSFHFEHSEKITTGLRCNCSICRRKGAVMTDFVIPPDEFHYTLKTQNSLSLYQFDNKIARHYFCNICGVFPFLQTMRNPDHYRVNLGCTDEINTDAIEISVFDGKSI